MTNQNVPMQNSQRIPPVERANPISRQQITDAFSARSNEFAQILQQAEANSGAPLARIVPMIVYAIANADTIIDKEEIGSFERLFNFETAVQIFRSKAFLTYFKLSDGRKNVSEIASLKYFENSRRKTDVFSELDLEFDQFSRAVDPGEYNKIREDLLNLCFIVANASGGLFEFEGNISDEEKYAASRIKAIFDRNFGYEEEGRADSLPVFLGDQIEKITLLFRSEFHADPSVLEITSFAFTVCEFFLQKYCSEAENVANAQRILRELETRFGLTKREIIELTQLRSPDYLRELLTTLKSLQQGDSVDEIGNSIEFASLVHRNVTNGEKIDVLLCLSALAPEILSFVLETANYITNVMPKDGRSD